MFWSPREPVSVSNHASVLTEALGWLSWSWTIHFEYVGCYARKKTVSIYACLSLSSMLLKSPSYSHIRSLHSCRRSRPFLKTNQPWNFHTTRTKTSHFIGGRRLGRYAFIASSLGVKREG